MLLRVLFLVLLLSPLFLLGQNRYDVVIDEIMADQTPQIGLPSNEWIELKNISANPINLQNWRIGDATGQSGPMPNFILHPDSFRSEERRVGKECRSRCTQLHVKK